MNAEKFIVASSGLAGLPFAPVILLGFVFVACITSVALFSTASPYWRNRVVFLCLSDCGERGDDTGQDAIAANPVSGLAIHPKASVLQVLIILGYVASRLRESFAEDKYPCN